MSPRLVGDGLVARLEIDDREAPVAEHAAAVGLDGSRGRGRDVRSPRSCSRPAPGRARPCRGVRRSRTCPVRKATRSCRVTSKGPSTTRSGSGIARCCERRPGGLRDRVADAAACSRRGCGARSSSARARPPHSARSATTSTGPRRPTRARRAAIPAAAVRREGAWLREQGLEPRFFCGGGWYTDAGRDGGRRRSRLRRLHGDRVAAVVPARRERRRAGLDQPAWVRLDDGRRVLELPTTHSLGAAASSLAAAPAAGRPCPLPRLRAARRRSDARRSR